MSINVEYKETHLEPGQSLIIEGTGRIEVLDVKPIGDELRWQYVVIRGERARR